MIIRYCFWYRSSCEGQDDGAVQVSIRLCCYIIHVPRHQCRKERWKVGGGRVTGWLNYSPVNVSLSSAKTQRQSL